MEVLLIILGIALIGLVILDFVWTTLWVQGGAGPITSKLTSSIWTLFRKGSRSNKTVLSLAGPMLLVTTVMSWILLFLAGWFCLITSNPDILSNSQHKGNAGIIDRIYYVGYTFFTLGSGNWTPSGDIWKVIAIIITASGMISITFAVTYLINVVSAVSSKRSFAQDVLSIGQTGTEILLTAWNGNDLHHLDKPLSIISSNLSTLSTQYNAYPILHYYFNKDSSKSAALAIAALDDALQVMEHHLPKETLPNPVIVKQTRSSILTFLDTLDLISVSDKTEEAPAPDLTDLREKGLPVQQAQGKQQQSDHRKKLLSLVHLNAREWPT
ncbi:potassium channel family protein [Terribacillus sp. DMT04]|uniref:potassium channel family protein n=1 Tax=Terribacillus sp. DMT04 TaxID=2850441 RepID=UPI001C2B960D|nr:potassium channel family protein [Terribacillus sp. DMT04]QXE02338.1 potassium channel family protein [Terribacillus sp. DMT04]